MVNKTTDLGLNQKSAKEGIEREKTDLNTGSE